MVERGQRAPFIVRRSARSSRRGGSDRRGSSATSARQVALEHPCSAKAQAEVGRLPRRGDRCGVTREGLGTADFAKSARREPLIGEPWNSIRRRSTWRSAMPTRGRRGARRTWAVDGTGRAARRPHAASREGGAGRGLTRRGSRQVERAAKRSPPVTPPPRSDTWPPRDHDLRIPDGHRRTRLARRGSRTGVRSESGPVRGVTGRSNLAAGRPPCGRDRTASRSRPGGES